MCLSKALYVLYDFACIDLYLCVSFAFVGKPSGQVPFLLPDDLAVLH